MRSYEDIVKNGATGEELFLYDLENNLGINELDLHYVEVNKNQNKEIELKKIQNFINMYIERYSKKRNIPIDKLRVEFINYGKTELVYVLTQDDNVRVTLLVKQPSVQFGKVHQEAQNLLELNKRDNLYDC